MLLWRRRCRLPCVSPLPSLIRQRLCSRSSGTDEKIGLGRGVLSDGTRLWVGQRSLLLRSLLVLVLLALLALLVLLALGLVLLLVLSLNARCRSIPCLCSQFHVFAVNSMSLQSTHAGPYAEIVESGSRDFWCDAACASCSRCLGGTTLPLPCVPTAFAAEGTAFTLCFRCLRVAQDFAFALCSHRVRA